MLDVGFQGLVNIGKETAWMKLVGPANERKKVSLIRGSGMRRS
jgi:hypothetical protein